MTDIEKILEELALKVAIAVKNGDKVQHAWIEKAEADIRLIMGNTGE
jgi:hypothetical protein